MKTLYISIIAILILTLGISGIAYGQYTANTIPMLTVWTDKPNYVTNDTVTVAGYIDKSETRFGHKLQVAISNPNGIWYQQDQFPVDQDGRFSYQFKLGGDLAVSGHYLVRVWSIEEPGMDVGTSFNVDSAMNSSIVNILVKQGSAEMTYSGDNITETIEYSITVQPHFAGSLYVDIFKNNHLLKTDTLGTPNVISFFGSGGQYYYYKLTISGKKDQDVYKIDFRYDRQSVEKIIPLTISSNGIVDTNLESPLKQFEAGTAAKDVTCKEGLQLVTKADDGSPRCVKPDTAQKLVERGWAKESVSQSNFSSKTIWNGNEGVSRSQSVKLSALGFNGTYNVGQQIDFKINLSGYGFTCPVPHVRIINPDLLAYWQGQYPASTCSSRLGEFDRTFDLSMFGQPVMNQSGDYVFEISYENHVVNLPFIVLPVDYRPANTKLWDHASEVICSALGITCNPEKTFAGESVGLGIYMATAEKNGTTYRIFLSYPIWCISANSSASCSFDDGLILDNAHAPATSAVCNGTAIPPGDYRSGLVPVLTLRPNSTAKVCVTYEFVQDWASYPNKDVYPFGIFQLGALGIGHIGSASSSPDFSGTSEPAWTNIGNVTAGSKLAVLYTIQADANSTGFYDSSVPYSLCSRYPLAVGYGTLHIAKSDFSNLILLQPPCVYSIFKIDSVNIVSGMNYTVVDFQ